MTPAVAAAGCSTCLPLLMARVVGVLVRGVCAHVGRCGAWDWRRRCLCSGGEAGGGLRVVGDAAQVTGKLGG